MNAVVFSIVVAGSVVAKVSVDCVVVALVSETYNHDYYFIFSFFCDLYR